MHLCAYSWTRVRAAARLKHAHFVQSYVSSSSRSNVTVVWLRIHNSPPSSSVMVFIFCCRDGSRVSVDTVHPSLLRSSSSSSPRWCHLQNLSSYVFLVSPLHVSKLPQTRIHAPLCDIICLQYLPLSLLSLSLSLSLSLMFLFLKWCLKPSLPSIIMSCNSIE